MVQTLQTFLKVYLIYSSPLTDLSKQEMHGVELCWLRLQRRRCACQKPRLWAWCSSSNSNLEEQIESLWIDYAKLSITHLTMVFGQSTQRHRKAWHDQK